MVDVEGNLRPFRIDRQNLIDLVLHLNQKLNEVSRPIKSIDITVMRFRKDCTNIAEMIAFLKDIHMPKVAKYLTLWIYGHTGLKISFYFSSESAKYTISDAKDMNQARSIEDTITEFFKKHTMPRLFSPYVGIILAMSLFLVAFTQVEGVVSSYLRGSVLAYRPFVLLVGICAGVMSVYVAWSVMTAESPPISFVHSVVYLDKPTNNSMWILVSTILVGIVISVISNRIG